MINNIILVASGKGGVGKSTVASILAFNLARIGSKVGLLDADIYGPSIPTIWNINSSEKISGVLYNKTQMLIPLEKYEVKLMSIGFFAKKNDAMILRGPMISSAINQMVTDVLWGNLDYLIVDLPPGTGDIQISLMHKFPISTSLIVTTMQNICFADVLRTKNMLDKMNISILGCITNMSYFKCTNCNVKHDVFSSKNGRLLLKSMHMNILSSIPFNKAIGQSIDNGNVNNFSDNTILNNKLLDLTCQIATNIAIKANETKKILYNKLPII